MVCVPPRSSPHLGLLVSDHVKLLLSDPGLGLIRVVVVVLAGAGALQPLSAIGHLVLEAGPRLLQVLQLLCGSLSLRSALCAGGRRHPPPSLQHLLHSRLVALDLPLQRLMDREGDSEWIGDDMMVAKCLETSPATSILVHTSILCDINGNKT